MAKKQAEKEKKADTVENQEFFTHETTINGKYEFTVEEKLAKAEKFGTEQQSLNALKEEKGTVMADFKSKITAKEEIINLLANHLANGYEYRNMKHTITYHKPKEGKKTIFNHDTKEEVVEDMQQEDFNLFNMYVDRKKQEGKETEGIDNKEESDDQKIINEKLDKLDFNETE